ncbi:MAG: dUTP diphosphatase [Pontibacterium sp.]
MNKTEWNGGECPVPAGTDVTVFFRVGKHLRDSVPEGWDWSHDDNTADIVAYINHDTAPALQVQLNHPAAQPPAAATPGSAGLDLYSVEDVTLWPGQFVCIDTGCIVAVPDGHAGLIWPRSGLAVKHGIDTLAGVIDSDYRQNVKVALINHSSATYQIKAGDRIAQMLIQKVETGAVVVEKISSSDRGGFGSTGK